MFWSHSIFSEIFNVYHWSLSMHWALLHVEDFHKAVNYYFFISFSFKFCSVTKTISYVFFSHENELCKYYFEKKTWDVLEFINLIHLFCEYGQLKMVEHVFKGCLASCRARLFKKSFTEAWYQYSSWCQGGPRSSDQIFRFVTATTLLMTRLIRAAHWGLTECKSLILTYWVLDIAGFP